VRVLVYTIAFLLFFSASRSVADEDCEKLKKSVTVQITSAPLH